MIRRLLLPILLFTSISLAGQTYVDLFAGIHPSVIDDGGASAHFSLSVGRQANHWCGYGLQLGTTGILDISTSHTITTLGLQYRLLTPNHRWFTRLEFGSLLGAGYGDDGFIQYTYQSGFYPYLRWNVGYRLGRFIVGTHYTYASPHQFSEALWDEQLNEYIVSGSIAELELHNVQLYIGLSLDAYPVQKKRK
jgi:hypothetical protein